MSPNGKDSASLSGMDGSRFGADSEPRYLALHRSGELGRRVAEAWDRLAACDLCPRACGVDRLSGERGQCRGGARLQVASASLHHWEEPPISGWRGSGTVFFANCVGRCIFCQNYPISQLGVGRAVSELGLAERMLDLQGRGAHNINLVTASHYLPQVLKALDIAAGRGLRIPLLYNTSGYDGMIALRLLDGVVDIYLPDAKYADDACASRLSGFHGYVAANRAALTEMARQVGVDLELDGDGIARRGLIIRHLVLPGANGHSTGSQTRDVLAWIANNLSPRVHVSLMSQYFPAYKAVDHHQLGRRLLTGEYDDALAAFEDLGLEKGWQQDLEVGS